MVCKRQFRFTLMHVQILKNVKNTFPDTTKIKVPFFKPNLNGLSELCKLKSGTRYFE